MLLVDEFIKLNASNEFKEIFFVVIQLGAIFAVIVLFFKKMLPFQFKKKEASFIKKDIIKVWLKVMVACIPGVIATLLLDDFIESNLHTYFVISLMLIIYGVAFIVIEKWNKNKASRINSLDDITYRISFLIGLFQVLALIPGTSRSGATIVGALLLGVNRVSASEFTFFLAVPSMLGLSILKLLKFGFIFNIGEITLLLIGVLVAFLVSIFVIRFLLDYIKKRDFKIFGIYRIILGISLILYFISV